MNSVPSSFTYIYGLIDPRTSQLRYIGKSNNPRVRYTKHVNDKSISHKCSWIEQLRLIGLLPWLIILDVVPMEQWQHFEADWITCFRSQLTNIADGGISPNHTEETRLKQSLAKKGKPAHNKGKTTSIETRKKQSIAAKLRFERMSEDERKAYIDHQNKNRTPESYSHKGHSHTEETRLKIGEASKGNKHTAALSKEQVIEIVCLIKGRTMQLKDIGTIYGIGIQTISNIKNGRSYADWTGIRPEPFVSSTTRYSKLRF